MKNKHKVLMVSKPIAPPWNDSAKNIYRDQLLNSDNYLYRIMTTPNQNFEVEGVVCEPIYKDRGKFSAGIRQNLRVMVAGLYKGDTKIYHYFFAPNTVTSIAGRIQRTIARVKTVQTICSAPASFDSVRKLIFTDRVIVLSSDTKRKLINAGVDENKLRLIPPGIEPIAKPSQDDKTRILQSFGISSKNVIIFPGDYEFSCAAQVVADASKEILADNEDSTIVFACRIKREASREIKKKIERQLSNLGTKVVFLDEIDNMPALVGACDLVLLPSESLFAKMDVPLVLLEAMSQGVPMILADVAPLNELLSSGAGIGILPKNPKALVEGVNRVLKDSALYSKLSSAGGKAVQHKYSAKFMTKEIERVYAELV